MPKYLLEISYTADGAKGLMKDGGSKRRAVADAAIRALGGKIESFYFAFGDADAYVVVDLPDATAAAAHSIEVAAGGGVRIKTTGLLSPEDVDSAVKKSGGYTPPGR